jgi:SAM-dependent methyltransferase
VIGRNSIVTHGSHPAIASERRAPVTRRKPVLRRLRDLLFVNSSRVHLARANAAFARGVEPGMRVLDAGAGDAPYQHMFAHAHYESADFEKVAKSYGETTYVCSLDAIPVEDNRFDRIVFNQVLEHLPEPITVLKELHRVLKPGGLMICSAPLYYEEHEQPYDFYRYTQFGHRHLFDRSSFEMLSIEWMEGYFGTVSYQMQCMFRSLPADPRALPLRWWLPLAYPVVLATKIMAGFLMMFFSKLDIASKFTQAGHPKNYVVIVRKPGAPSAGR